MVVYCLVVGTLCVCVWVGWAVEVSPHLSSTPIFNQMGEDRFFLFVIAVDSGPPFLFLVVRAPCLQFSSLFRTLGQSVYLKHLNHRNNRETVVYTSVIH